MGLDMAIIKGLSSLAKSILDDAKKDDKGSGEKKQKSEEKDSKKG